MLVSQYVFDRGPNITIHKSYKHIIDVDDYQAAKELGEA